MSQSTNWTLPVFVSTLIYSVYNSALPIITILILNRFCWHSHKNKTNVTSQLKIHIFMWFLGMISTLSVTVPNLIGLLWKGGSFLRLT